MLYLKKVLTYMFTLMGCFFFTACDMMDYHPYDTRFDGKRDINTTNVKRIKELTEGKKDICFAVISDTQRWYDETHRIVNHINNTQGIDFVIHCGDLTDFSLTDEFVWMRDELEEIRVPYVVAIGNHDCLGTGKSTFREMFGPLEYSFTAGNTHFVVINTNGLEFSDDEDFFGVKFMHRDLGQLSPKAERTVVVMHAPIGSDQFPKDESEDYLEMVTKYPNLQFGLCGHIHSTAIHTPFENHVPYYQTACAEKLSYLLFHLKADGTYTYEEIFV